MIPAELFSPQWGFVLVLALICFATVLIVAAALVRQERRVAVLERQLAMFVEASINVADSVHELQSGDPTAPKAEVFMPNRRLLLQEAQARLEAGERLSDVAQPLGLSREEVSLLRLSAA